MVSKHWPDGVVCSHRGSSDVHYFANQRRWKCKGKHEKRQFSVKTGTVIEESPLGLEKWVAATWMIVNAKKGISSFEIHRALGVTQKSAWFLLHRIRLALNARTFEKISGAVEADVSYVRGKLANMKKSKLKALRAEHKEPGKPVRLGGRMTLNKEFVMGLLQRGEDGNRRTGKPPCHSDPCCGGSVQGTGEAGFRG